MINLKTSYLILLGAILLIDLNFASAQEAELTTYDSKEDGLYFDQALIYSYSDHTGLSREVWIYYSTCSKRFLFDQAAWGREDEMVHYVIAQPDGSYLTFGTEAEGPGVGKVVLVDSVYLENRTTPVPAPDQYIEFVLLPGADKVIAGLASKGYEVRKLRDGKGLEKIHLATVDFDPRMIYHFNQYGYDLQLPNLLSQDYRLGSDQLITQYESKYTDSKGSVYWSKLKLVTLDPTMYWAMYHDYNLRMNASEGKVITRPVEGVIKLFGPCY
jgi:hypothetical protein